MKTLVKRVQEAVRAEPSRSDDQDTPAAQRKRTYMWGGMLALIALIMGLNWIVLKREIDHRIANAAVNQIWLIWMFPFVILHWMSLMLVPWQFALNGLKRK